MKAVAYTCVHASELEARSTSTSQQQAAIVSYAEREGLQLVGHYADDPIGPLASAPALGDFCSRSGLFDLLESADKAPWIRVVVTSPDRIERPDLDFSPTWDLRVIGKILTVVGEPLNLPSPSKAREKKKPRKAMTVAERLLRGREAGARAGKHQSGPAPYGYVRDYSERAEHGVRLAIEPDEAEVVRLIFREYLRRKSMKKLIEYLTKMGHRTRRGKQWSRAGVSWVLKNETYLGRVHFGRIRARGLHQAIISRIVFNKVQKLMAKNNKRGGKKRGSK